MNDFDFVLFFLLFREAISEQERFCHKKDNHIMFPIYNQSSMSYVSRLNSKKYAQGLWFLRLDQIYYFLMYTFVRFFLSFMSAYIHSKDTQNGWQ